MNDAKERLMSEAMKKGYELSRRLRDAEKDAQMWKAAFYELLDYHFAHGGDSPNLRFERINDRATPPSERYEMRNNVDYVTVVRRECWR